ncbi:EAL domain-containing protein [Pseudomonas asplenii]|uniref:EAL domain, c-di-GMP-specific phosphodiesterase class I (Or its enzymatically inactive variant) n=1 Tax=Pseudomonas asplenii TaxID=53407 RepID=A0A1H6LZ52_9PSED|nr:MULTISPECIES: EAL domain-containing protein [Pseudomonas]UZE28974.1 EAL domain-containing protein [Pseudomonas asplenii]SEH94174.1 EAL domain, c-di-GMP-specific phosphodiesterase class I (or its enzymatically inactive variant) [Pseudomonas fuscovaginae]
MVSHADIDYGLEFCSVDAEETPDFAHWFYDELAQGHFFLAFQPIMSVGTKTNLYYEGLLRHCDGPMKLNPFPILEGRKCIRALDHCVVSSVINMLRDYPEIRLGCNISAQSAVLDEKWNRIISQLEAEPGLAERLVIEITESASSNNTAAADFVIRMRRLGCLLAVDDFGSGFSTLEFIRAASPDIIKIDKGYLQRARTCEVADQAFGHLVGLCKTLAPHVIAEGVEFESDTERLMNCAAAWMQGFLVGKPQRLLPGVFRQCVIENHLP